MLFLKGYSRRKIFAIPKGERPKPSVYLPKEYIANHLKKFEEGVSFITKEETLETYGREILGMPDNSQFVMTKIEMDEVLKKANGNLAVIEKELGIPSGSWKDKKLLRIDVGRHQNLRVPDGNEMGANPLWLPGGKLPQGYNEAVIDCINEGNYIETKIVLR